MNSLESPSFISTTINSTTSIPTNSSSALNSDTKLSAASATDKQRFLSLPTNDQSTFMRLPPKHLISMIHLIHQADFQLLKQGNLRISEKGLSQISPIGDTTPDRKSINPLKNYTKVRELGKGNFGTAYEYRHKDESTPLAIKTFRYSVGENRSDTNHEIIAHLALADRHDGVDVKKILIDENHTVHIVMELLEKIPYEDRYDALMKNPGKYPAMGITLNDRHGGNIMGRRSEFGSKLQPVNTDYGICDIDIEQLMKWAETESEFADLFS